MSFINQESWIFSGQESPENPSLNALLPNLNPRLLSNEGIIRMLRSDPAKDLQNHPYYRSTLRALKRDPNAKSQPFHRLALQAYKRGKGGMLRMLRSDSNVQNYPYYMSTLRALKKSSGPGFLRMIKSGIKSEE